MPHILLSLLLTIAALTPARAAYCYDKNKAARF